MVENEIKYEYESQCKICGQWKLTSNGVDFTMTADTKERYGMGSTDHDCEFTTHEKLEEPVSETIEY